MVKRRQNVIGVLGSPGGFAFGIIGAVIGAVILIFATIELPERHKNVH
jgi:uncharacterized membrane protein YeaQ/YmgE (transglycosylase-associated protein family)